jgi:hypothetical protein
VFKRRVLANKKLEELEEVVLFRNLDDISSGGGIRELVATGVDMDEDVTAGEPDELDTLARPLE